MNPDASHFGEELQDFLDQRLEPVRRAVVASHLESCGQCRRELHALRWARDSAHKLARTEDVPAALADRVRGALDGVDGDSRRERGRPQAQRRRLVLAGAFVSAAAIVLFFVTRARTPDFRDSVARDFIAVSSGRLPLVVQSRDPGVIERYFASNGIAFTTRVFDLGMMGYELTGGRVHRLDGRASALFAYRATDGRLLVCQMYEGTVDELPPAAETRVHNGMSFFVHRVGGTTLVFWQEGDMVCVLASDAAPEDVIQLAFAKAVKV